MDVYGVFVSEENIISFVFFCYLTLNIKSIIIVVIVIPILSKGVSKFPHLKGSILVIKYLFIIG